MSRQSLSLRFEEFVQQGEGCWIWTGKTDSYGYGMCGRERAHRVSWIRIYGPIAQGENVLHRCDTPPCVRPDHLFLGTIADNNRDRHTKGRSRGLFVSGNSHPATQRRGERHWQAKLTDEDVRAIRNRRGAGEKVQSIAGDYGIHNATVSRIARGIWRKEETS